MTSKDDASGPRRTPETERHLGRGWAVAGSAAAALAGAALFNLRSARQAEAETPPEGSFIEVDGVRLHLVDRGTGDAVVLLHGNAVTLQDFAASGVSALAAEHHRVLAFDRPGFGYSDRPRTTLWTPKAQARLIIDALASIGVERACVVGHSWGAMVALAMAIEAPDLVTGLVLMSGYYYPTARPDVVFGSGPAIPILGDLAAWTVSPIAGRLVGPLAVKASFSPAPVSSDFDRFPAGLSLRPSQIRAASADTAMMVPAAAELSRHYRQLRVPTIIMAGQGDRIAHVDKHAERLAREIPDAELRIVPGQGHMFHYAVTEQVVAAIDDVSRNRSIPDSA